MRSLHLTREQYIPPGAACVRHKASGAIAYLYTSGKGKPAALGFYGKGHKPNFRYAFASEEVRERHVANFFRQAQALQEIRALNKAKARAPSKLQLGHILVASWGYEQTNINFYQVTRLISAGMVEVRAIASNNTEDTAWAQGKCMPRADAFTGEPMRRRVRHSDGVRIDDCRIAHLWDGRPMSWTAYH